MYAFDVCDDGKNRVWTAIVQVVVVIMTAVMGLLHFEEVILFIRPTFHTYVLILP